jgi:hypothetical protein
VYWVINVNENIGYDKLMYEYDKEISEEKEKRGFSWKKVS